MLYYILALDEREYGPLDLPTLKQWLLDYRVTPGTMLIDADTRVTTTLRDVLQASDPGFLAHANDLAFWASHQACLNCGRALAIDATVCGKCGILASPPRSDTDGPLRALKIVGLILGGVGLLFFAALFSVILYHFVAHS